MARLSEGIQHLHPATDNLVSREVARRRKETVNPPAIQSLKQAARRALRWSRSKGHYRDYINITAREHMSSVDCFDGKKARTGETANAEVGAELADEDLITVHPAVDGRLKDVGRSE
jgi:5'-nucleotidase